MTVNYRRSVNGSNDQLGRKYLSDSLTPWWGSWSNNEGALAASYTDLPPESGVLMTIVSNHIGAGQHVNYYLFNDFVNLRGMYLDFWVKGISANGMLTLFFYPYSGGPQTYGVPYGLGANPTVWTKYTIRLDTLPAYNNMISRTLGLARCKYVLFYWDNLDVGLMKLSGVNFRRP